VIALSRGRWLMVVAAVTVLGSVAATIGLGWSLSRPVPARIGQPPSSLPAESITFASRSGSEIHGWMARGQPGAGAVLLLPGVRDNRRGMLAPAQLLHDAGHSVMLIDFQATGESAGDAITFGWRERLDVIGAVDELSRRLPGERVGIVGRSLGGAATILSAGEISIHGAVLEVVYPSIEAAVANRLRIRLGQPGTWLSPLLLLQLSPWLGIGAGDLRPVDHIAQLSCPILLVAATNDQHTTVRDTEQLFAAARAPKELWMIQGADHNSYRAIAGEEYRKRLVGFFKRTLQPGAANR
jgi:fermentation-respiration switch protein FrsA (DUF1100 family)